MQSENHGSISFLYMEVSSLISSICLSSGLSSSMYFCPPCPNQVGIGAWTYIRVLLCIPLSSVSGWLVFLISLSGCSRWVYRNATNFACCILSCCLLNGVIRCRGYLVAFLRSFVYRIMSSLYEDSLTCTISFSITVISSFVLLPQLGRKAQS